MDSNCVFSAAYLSFILLLYPSSLVSGYYYSSSSIAMSFSRADLDTILQAQRSAFESCLKVFTDSVSARVDGLLTQAIEIKSGLASVNSRVELLENREPPISQRLIEEITSSIENLEEKADYLENQSRRNNLRVEGLPETPGETWAGTEAALRSALVTDLGLPLSDVEKIDIERAHRVGKPTATTTTATAHRRWKTRAVVVKFNKFKDRDSILKKRGIAALKVSSSKKTSAPV